MKLVGYGRVSTENQKDNTSLAAQKQAIKTYCIKNDHQLVAYYEDAETGSSIEARENFLWALETVEHAADGLIIYKLDRLTRNVEDGEKLKKRFKKMGKVLLSVADVLDIDSSDGQFVFTIGTALAELERRRIRDRCEAGRLQKQEQGGWIGGSPPFGFAAYQKSLIELPNEQKTIELIRQLYLEGWPMSHIAKRLNQMRIPTKQRARGGWRWGMIKTIVDGDPPVVARLRAEGKILPASKWEEIYTSPKTV